MPECRSLKDGLQSWDPFSFCDVGDSAVCCRRRHSLAQTLRQSKAFLPPPQSSWNDRSAAESTD